MFNIISNLLKKITILVLLFSIGKSFAQEVTFSLVNSTPNEVVIRVDFPDYETVPVNVNGQMMNRLVMGAAYPIEEAGAPELLMAAQAIIIPQNCNLNAQIIESDYRLVSNFELAPSKGRLYRDVNPADIPYSFGNQYNENSFFKDETVSLNEPFQFRDFHGVSVKCYPFAYNPVQKSLKVYKYQIIRVTFGTPLTDFNAEKMTSEFANIYKRYFLNFEPTRYDAISESGELLIIAHDAFLSALEPLVQWKTKSGYPTTLVSKTQAGTTANAIKTYITNFYNEHNLAFVIIVGDNAQFPSFTLSGNTSDNYYTEIAGNDNVPDIILGKISAENVTQVTNQVQKFIQYEENPVETSHLPVFLGIGSSEGPGDNNEYDYQHIRNIDNNLSSFTYTSGYEMFEGSQGGLDVSGNPNASMVTQALNSGVGIINYCGHGSSSSFVTTNFSSSHINSLANYNKLPFIFAVACSNGDYVSQTCFAETWLRAYSNGQPTGAVGVLMSSMVQPWNAPMCAQDEMNRVMTGANASAIKRTFGGISFDGLLKMLDVYNDYETMRTWIVFGDPTLNIRTAIPQALTVTHDNSIALGINQIVFSSSVEDARITLTVNDQIISQGTINNGTATLTIPTLSITDTIQVVATAFNYIPYQGNITIDFYEDAYIVYKNHVIDDQAGNHNAHPDYGETVAINLCLRNVGLQDASTINVTLRCNDAYVTLIDSTFSLALLTSLNENCTDNTFSFSVSSTVPYNHIANFTLVIHFNDETLYQNFTQRLYAPELTVNNYIINDSESTSVINGRLDFNESADFEIDLANTGDATAMMGTVMLESTDGKLLIHRTLNNISSLSAGSDRVSVFRISVNNSITEQTTAQLRLKYRAGNYSVTKEFMVQIGLQVEDWESHTFNTYDWQNTTSHPWTITAANTYEGDYSARSGIISNNQTSNISIEMEVAQPDSISFYYFVSSEAGNGNLYDRLEFYIDNSRKDYWDGEVAWSRTAYPVSAGNHTFEWRYVKDMSATSGSDMAMIDYILFPIQNRNTTDIEQHTSDNTNISLYPNPATDQINITFSAIEDLPADGVIELYDLTGKLLATHFINDTKTNLSVASYPAGSYLIRIIDADQTIKIFKFIKQ